MAIQTISVSGVDSSDIAKQVKQALAGFEPKLILFFASDIYDQTNPAAALQCAFADCAVIGSTSHSEYCGSTFCEGTVSVMAMDAQSVQNVCVKVVRGIKSQPDFSPVLQEMHAYFGGTDHIFDHFDRFVGIVLFEGSSKAEEYCMSRLGASSDILFVGGTSSTYKANQSRVYMGDQSYEDAMVLAVLETVDGYDVLKTQSAQVFSKQGHIVTKSDMRNRIIYELDNRPVAQVYAQVLGIAQADVANYFVSNPLGVLAEEEIFVRTFNECVEGGISVHCGIPEGTQIHILKIGDIVQDTKKDLDRVIAYKPAGVINFNCLYRTFEILNKSLVQPYCDLFGRYPNIGFSTAGEAYLGHINETSTVLIIK